jgi:hypothetical protein
MSTSGTLLLPTSGSFDSDMAISRIRASLFYGQASTSYELSEWPFTLQLTH